MALFGSSACPHCEDYRRQRDDAQRQLAMMLADQSALLKEVLAVKRHDLGLPPAGFTPSDPVSVLGPKTLAAIERATNGFPDARAHQTNFAITEAQAMLAEGHGPEEIDTALAQRIREGDG